MRTCDRCGSRMPPFLPRKRDGEQMICEGCQAWNKRVAVFKKKAVLHNPTAELQGRNGDEWYHGSKHDFDDFGDHGSHHWNTLIGHHFSAEHEIAEKFSRADESGGWDENAEPSGDASPGHIIHTKLHIKRPKTYRSEHDMDQEVYEHERARGNHIDNYLDRDDLNPDPQGRGDVERYRGDSQRHYSPKYQDHGQYRQWEEFHPAATGWLNNHPDKENITQRFKQRLKDQGYDGIVYGNSFEETQDRGPKHRDYYDHPPLDTPEVSEHNKNVPQASISAIAFEPHQIEVTQHHYGDDCKTPEELSIERRKNSVFPHHETGHSQHYLPSMDSLHLTHSAAKAAAGHYCKACGTNHDSASEAEEHGWSHTDWDKHYPEVGDVHRGLAVRLPPELHDKLHHNDDYEHDDDLTVHEVIQHLGKQPLGLHWSADEDVAKRFAHDYTGSAHGDRDHPVTNFVLTGERPKREHIETDARKLGEDEEGIQGFDTPEREVPLKAGTKVRLKGIQWKRPEHTNHQYRDHDLDYIEEQVGPMHVTAAMDEERAARIQRIREERKNRKRPTSEEARSQREKRDNAFSRYFTPIPEEELEEQRRRAEPKPERIDDRTYSVNDVSKHYDWEGFDEHEISHLVHKPEQAMFTHENVPIKSLRVSNDKKPVSYQEIADQGEDEQERLHELERGYERGESIPPIVVVRHGDRHIIADGSHRAAIHAQQGHTHIPAFVTERTKFPKTASWDDDDDDEPEYCEDCGEEHTEDEGHRECAGCGERHEDYEEKTRHESTMTNWDKTYPHLNDTVHRVLPDMRLPDHVHQVVHDDSRPMHERGQALLNHVDSEHGHGLGMHWSDVFGEGRGHGADKFAGVGGGDPKDTQVVLHAHKPDRDYIEDNPDTLDEHQVYGYDEHDENEVPIAQRAPVHITGVSWRPGGYHQEWRRHNLTKPMEMTAVKKLPSLRTIAHDATENQEIRHCAFCGGGKIIGRADGSVECEFCHNYFTVQVQPQYPNFPQTVNGEPQQIPGMPGQVETPGGAPGMPGELPPGEEDGGNPFADDGDGPAGGPDEGTEDKGDDSEPPPFAKKSFRTVTGARLPEDEYARHLAIRLAPDRAAMIARIRTERGAQ